MTNELTTINNITDLVVSTQSKYATEVAKQLATSQDFLPYVSITDTNNKLVKAKKVEAGIHALIESKDSVIPLGEDVVLLFLSWRPKAMDFNDEVPTVVYDSQSEMFKDIERRASQPNSGCAFGVEFLVWVPSHKRFATYFFGSKTLRREASEILIALESGPCVLKRGVRFIETKRYSWYGGTTTQHDASIEVPTLDELRPVLDKFNNPEVLEEAESDER